MGKWIAADSEAIKGFRYDERAQILRVRFTSGGEYDYLKATPALYEKLMAAPSKGQFFIAAIRDKLAFRRVG